jgi:hypothetical protein
MKTLNSPKVIVARAALAALGSALACAQVWAQTQCEVKTGARVTPVIELYTSEGCSSCPPADRWLSTLKGQPVVAQAFHVGYWDYIGWVDRFATPAHTARQRDLAALNNLRSIYTPQVLRNGRDWRDFSTAVAGGAMARAAITVQRIGSTEAYEARVTPGTDVKQWQAYWTVTEHGYNSKVKAGENSGEFLQHDFVVRQYVPLGRYEGANTVRLGAIPAVAGHSRQVNLVVTDPATGDTLQAASLQCG